MMDDLRPLGLVQAARRLKIDPFELIRIEVGLGSRLERLGWSGERVALLEREAGIEVPWLDPGKRPSSPAGRVRESFGELVRRGLVGEKSTRLDNLARELPAAEGEMVRRAAPLMAEEGLLVLSAGRTGAQVAVKPGMESKLAAIAAGSAESRGLLDALTE